MNDSQLPNIHRIDVGFSAPGLVANDADRAVMNRYVEAVENMFNIRTSFLQQMLDPRRDIDAECGYPETVAGGGFGSINPDLYRALYEREAISNRVVQIYPNACWQKSPMVFESEDPEVVTPFEEAWDNIAKQLRGEVCHYQDEEGSPIWNYCHRVDTLSGIGAFGVMLLGIADGRNLDQPLDGVSSYDPTGNMEVQWEDVGDEIREVPYIDPVTNRVVTRATKVRRDCFIRNLVINSETKQLEEKIVGLRRSYGGRKTAVYPTTPRAVPDPTCNDLEVTTYPIYEGDPKTGMPRLVRREAYPGVDSTNNQASPTNNGVTLPQQALLSNSSDVEVQPTAVIINELPSRFSETSMESAQDGTRPNFQHKVSAVDGGTGPQTVEGTGILSSGQLGTDAQYTGVQLSPSEYPSTKGSKEAKRLLFIRCYDESLVQIVQYEANVRNPRFGMPVMYRITLNDPREQHSGIGLPMATVRVHWSRIIHVSDNNGSSEIFGVPRMRPVLNRLLDLRKIYASSAEGYWQQAFAKLVLSTHPQLGGDVKVNVPQLQNMLENVRNGLQREMLLMGMGASTVAPSVTDPTSHIAVHIEAICIQLGCPVRVFKGSERGELASDQDDDEWLDHVRFRQHNQCTPKILIPLIDRLIAAGVLPAPGSGAEPVGKKVPMGKGWKKEGKGKDATNGNGSGSNGNALGMKSSDSPSSDLNDEESSVIGNRMTWNRVLEKWERVSNAFPPKAGQPQTPSPSSQENGKGGDGAEKGGPPQSPAGAPAPKPPKVEVPDSGKPVGYSVQWPDLDSLGDKDKAAIALQIVQSIQAYIAGGCEAVLPVFDFFVHVLGWDEEMVTPILLKVRAAAEKDDQGEPVEPPLTTPPHGEPGHPTSAAEPLVFMSPKGQQGNDQGEGEEPEDELEDAPSTNSVENRERLEAIFNWCNKYGGTTCKDGSGFTHKEKETKSKDDKPTLAPRSEKVKPTPKPKPEKSLSAFAGKPCGPGQSAARTGCIPKSQSKGKGVPSKDENGTGDKGKDSKPQDLKPTTPQPTKSPETVKTEGEKSAEKKVISESRLKEGDEVIHDKHGLMTISDERKGKLEGMDKEGNFHKINPEDINKDATEKHQDKAKQDLQDSVKADIEREDKEKQEKAAREKKEKEEKAAKAAKEEKEIAARKGAPANVKYTDNKILRSAREALEHPALKAMGGSLNVKDPHERMVSQHLQDLTKVPPKLAEAVRDFGATVHVGRGSILGLNSNKDLEGVQSSQNAGGYDNSPAVYRPGSKSACAGTDKNGNDGTVSYSGALHEYGHAVDHALGLKDDSELDKIHRDQYSKLRPYYQNGGPGGDVGKGEMVAEGFAAYHKDKEGCRKDFGDAFVGWLSKKLKGYQ